MEKKTDISDEVSQMSETEAENMLFGLMNEKNPGAANSADGKEIAASVVSDAHSALDEAKQAK